MQLAALLLLLTCAPAFAGPEPIRGAFGVQLGEQFAAATRSMGDAALGDGTPVYQFPPQHPYPAFDSYWVGVTPTSERVYRILARGTVTPAEACANEAAVLVELLGRKYGPLELGDRRLGDYTAKRTLGQREVAVVCTDTYSDPAVLMLIYQDEALVQAAETERIQAAADAADGSGL